MSYLEQKPKIFIGSGNPHKIREISEILARCGFEAIAPEDAEKLPDVEEDGETFEENAAKKAVAYAKFVAKKFTADQGPILALADDSGIEVQALDNAPGVRSSRYAENDENRIARLLKALSEANTRTGRDNRRARFVCVMALADKDGVISLFRGEAPGRIVNEARGKNGFGYDPIFVPDADTRTFAEIPPHEKNKISHRARALSKLELYLGGGRQRLP